MSAPVAGQGPVFYKEDRVYKRTLLIQSLNFKTGTHNIGPESKRNTAPPIPLQ